MEIKHNDQYYMQRAIELARLGHGHVSPNPAVGCVIVGTDGNIAGEGWHRCFGQGHAEVNAVAAVRDKKKLVGATVYVTLEPCSHYGKTPPCALMLSQLPIARVVVGSMDPNPKVSGRGLQMLREAGIEVDCGVLEHQCRAINPAFLTAQEHHRPFVTLKWACDANGAMGSSDGSRILFSNPPGIMWTHRQRTLHDAIMIGRHTAITDNPTLTSRHWPGRQPRPIVIGGDGSALPQLKLATNDSTLWLPHVDDLETLMETLYLHHGITSLLVEGGATLLQAFLDAGIWDRLRRETSAATTAADIPAPAIPADAIAESTLKIGTNTLQTWRRSEESGNKQSGSAV